MRLALGALSLSLGAVPMLCRYTIRDIGFVDLHPDAYVLTRAQFSGAGGGPALTSELATLGAVLCRETNLRVAGWNALRSAPDAFALLLDDAGLDGAWFLSRTDLPPLMFNLPAHATDPEGELRAAVGWALDSKLRSEWREQALSTFACLWIVEGQDAQANAAALAQVEAALDALDRLAPSLPRPLQYPARVRRIGTSEQDSATVSLWSLGLADSGQRPAVVVLYGRAKRAGKVLVGDAIQETELVTQLALVGSSCECDTDRQWVAEPSLPLRWPRQMQTLAAHELGFDPQSPLVVAEVRRILSRVQATRSGSGSAGGVAAILLGYRESEIGVDPSPATPAHRRPGSEPRSPASLTPASGDDWSFEEQTPDPLAAADSWASKIRFSVLGSLLLLLAGVAALCIWVFTRLRRS